MLDGVDFPRFHCSRCDHIFSKEENLFRADDEQTAPEAAAPAPATPAPVRERWTMGNGTTRSLEVPRHYDIKKPASAPHENAGEAAPGRSQTQIEFDFSTANEAIASLTEKEDWTAPMLPQEESGPAYREQAAAEKRALAKLPAQTAWDALRDHRPAAWRSMLYIVLPIVGFLMLLWISSHVIKANAGLGDHLAQTLAPGAEQVAPSGLMISRVHARTVSLEDGERVRVISGTLENKTEETFSAVSLQALTFDESGRQVAEMKVDAESTLAKTRIKSLSLDMIKELQTRKSAKRFALKPGDKTDFVIALPIDAPDSVRYYGARIYSVRN